MTPHREMVHSVLCEMKKHLSATEVWDLARARGSDISLATVYNSLRYLVDEGLAREIHMPEGISCFDARLDEHGHLRCEQCGTLSDIDFSRGAASMTREAERLGFRALQMEITVTGICPACQKSA